MTKLKVGGLGAAAQTALDPHIAGLYSKPGGTLLGIVEFEHVERTQPGPRSDKEASVTVKATHLEVPVGEQIPQIREALRALYLLRTARGTLDEDQGTIKASEETLRLAAAQMFSTRAVDLTIALTGVGGMARNAYQNHKATAATMRADLQKIAGTIDAILAAGRQLELDGGDDA